MSDPSFKNMDLIGVVLVFLLVSRRSGKIPAIGQAIDFDRFTHDLHRMVDVIDQVDNLGQFALPKPASSFLPSVDLSPADQVSEEAEPASFGSGFHLPDLGQLMDMAGPLLSILGSGRLGSP